MREAAALLDKFHAALRPLAPINEGMVLARGRAGDREELRFPSRNMRPVNDLAEPPTAADEEEEDENKKGTTMEEEEDDDRDEDDDTIALSGEYLLIDLGPVHGQYTIQADPANRLIRLQSPLSGAIPYRHDAASGEWCSVHDDHNLTGMLVRDLIRQIQGVPQL